jgi:hypothetical protein
MARAGGPYGKDKGGKGKPGGKGFAPPEAPEAPPAAPPGKYTEAELGTPNNPGLLDDKEAFQGIVKQAVDPNSGVGFVSDEKVTQTYGKDASLYATICPWVQEMDLQEGDSVLFNLADEPQDEPQITHIIRIAC